ncbi:tRNA (adenosine(37)-N6)-threonylcarbamoyltransferase complex ATPase subunit type 1 TsaE [Weeksellaceae bacterium TAE3-ERU29]|nr:tRNA (adenosine(37)-N6)-threonylcarbamoyltransferase complex ATPase subunit type 1 TsaE [Weeksellaceae bacterium TAE3-ERU29]
MKKFIAKDIKDLEGIAQELLPLFKEKVVLFKGEMGAGKTTLITEILKQMNSEDEASSPTYSLVNEYQTDYGIVYHFDFYRINDEEEAYDMGWEEYAYSEDFCFVEWPERIKSLIPEKYHILEILNDNETRIINFE